MQVALSEVLRGVADKEVEGGAYDGGVVEGQVKLQLIHRLRHSKHVGHVHRHQRLAAQVLHLDGHLCAVVVVEVRHVNPAAESLVLPSFTRSFLVRSFALESRESKGVKVAYTR